VGLYSSARRKDQPAKSGQFLEETGKIAELLLARVPGEAAKASSTAAREGFWQHSTSLAYELALPVRALTLPGERRHCKAFFGGAFCQWSDDLINGPFKDSRDIRGRC